MLKNIKKLFALVVFSYIIFYASGWQFFSASPKTVILYKAQEKCDFNKNCTEFYSLKYFSKGDYMLPTSNEIAFQYKGLFGFKLNNFYYGIVRRNLFFDSFILSLFGLGISLSILGII
jgi:hypothetical protein